MAQGKHGMRKVTFNNGASVVEVEWWLIRYHLHDAALKRFFYEHDIEEYRGHIAFSSAPVVRRSKNKTIIKQYHR
jgi:hypothetical protein